MPAPFVDDEIDALINEVAPPPLVVSEPAVRQLRPLLLELIARRKASQTASAASPVAGVSATLQEFYGAASAMDWGQVVANGGPPCFHIENGGFCGRAGRWEGHKNGIDHAYIPLDILLSRVAKLAQP